MEHARDAERRWTVAGWIVAGAVAVLAWWIDRRPPLLVDAPSCAGAVEFTAALVTRLAPDLSIGATVLTLNLIGNALAIALVTRVAAVASQSLAAGAALGLAFARLFAFTPVYAGADSAALAAAAFTALAVLAARRSTASVRVTRRLVPWIGIAASVAVAGLVPGLGQCTLDSAPSWARLAPALHAAFATTSPLVIGLVIFGLTVVVTETERPAPVRRVPTYAPAIDVGLSLVAASCISAPATRLLAPVVIACVAFAAIGLGSLMRRLSTPPTAARRAAGVALLLAVAVIHLPASIPGPTPIADRPLGVEVLSQRTFAAVRAALPSPAALIDDEAMVRILAESGAAPGVEIVPRVPEQVREAAARGPVFALPLAQLALMHQGFALEAIDGTATGVDGLARVTPAGECATARGVWRDAPGLGDATSVALVAPSPEARGPLVAYVAGASAFSPAPHDWPAAARRGWYATVYDRAQPERARALQSDLAADVVPDGLQTLAAPLAAPFVARLEMWRVPDAPLILDVALGGAATSAIVRASNASDSAHVLLCPSRPVDVVALHVRR